MGRWSGSTPSSTTASRPARASSSGSGSVYNLRVISLGAGVQSTTLYRMAALGEITPLPDVAIFADTQQEPSWVYENLDRLEQDHGDVIPIRRATRGNLGESVKVGFASVPFWVKGSDGRETLGRRQCTREFKIDVVKREIRTLLGLRRGERAQGRFLVEEWVGISLDEAHRAKPSRASFRQSKRFPRRIPHNSICSETSAKGCVGFEGFCGRIV